jgi:hypothetical protein
MKLASAQIHFDGIEILQLPSRQYSNLTIRRTPPTCLHPCLLGLCGVRSHTHGTSLKTRCTTLVPMPSFLPILRMP